MAGTSKDDNKDALVLLSFSHCYPDASDVLQGATTNKEEPGAASESSGAVSFTDRVYLPDPSSALPCVSISSWDDLNAFCSTADASNGQHCHYESSSTQRAVLLELKRRTDGAALPKKKSNSLAFQEFMGLAKYFSGVLLEQFEFVELRSTSNQDLQRKPTTTTVSLQQLQRRIKSRLEDDEKERGSLRFGIQPSHSASAQLGNGGANINDSTPAMVSYEAWLRAAGLCAAPVMNQRCDWANFGLWWKSSGTLLGLVFDMYQYATKRGRTFHEGIPGNPATTQSGRHI